jgi:hypothetical protein
MQKPHPLVVYGFLNLTLGLQILQWLLINEDNGFLSHKIVLPLANILNHGVEFLIIHKVVQDSTMKKCIMISYWLTSLHQYHSYSISACICLQFERIFQVGECKNKCLIDPFVLAHKNISIDSFPTKKYYHWCLWPKVA